jgi:anaerobic ribonucleoside-triphosphate reductase activating protein
MRISGINENDVVNGKGICVSVFMQGCPHQCKGCFNPETWDFKGGRAIEDEQKEINNILNLINQNGVQRNLSILGGEPLHKINISFVKDLLRQAKEKYPTIKTFVWTGYLLEELDKNDLQNIDILIDGKFVEELRDISLELRGSSNQRILYKGKDF